jgi:hypothetical protein
MTKGEIAYLLLRLHSGREHFPPRVFPADR